jgi:ERO1-like protein beta
LLLLLVLLLLRLQHSIAMRPGARLFFLAVYALLGASRAHGGSTDAKDQSPNVCAVSPSRIRESSVAVPSGVRRRRHAYQTFSQYEPNSIVSDACASYSTLEQLNSALHPQIHELTHYTDFFSHYRLNLFNKKCPYWDDENGMCGNIHCAVNTLENENDIPIEWRADELGRIQGPKAQHPGRAQQQERPPEKPLQGQLGEDVDESCVVEYDDECDERDYCVPEDESATAKGDYVSLKDNPEGFTGYSGPGARQVWEAIYRENCFAKKPEVADSVSPISPFGSSNKWQAQAASDLRSVLKEHNIQKGFQQAIAKGREESPLDDLDLEFDEECVEKRVFYRIISGMHASISTHICYNYANQSTQSWYRNMDCYKSRLHGHPERISNLYFNYALLLRAVGKLNGHMRDFTFCHADGNINQRTKSMLMGLSKSIGGQSGEIFDESIMFKSPDAVGLKEDFKQRFRNVSRIMDCVGCDKCRLWGKIQTNGYGTALKVLFEFDDRNPRNNPPLRRTELVALINTLDRVSHSLMYVNEFRNLVDAEEKAALQHANKSTNSASESPTSPPSTPNTTQEAEEDGGPPFARRNDPDMSILEIFYDELDLFLRTFKFVVRSWFALPGKM